LVGIVGIGRTGPPDCVACAQPGARQRSAGKRGAETAVVGDLSSIAQTRGVAVQINRLGRFDAVIHNDGVGYRESRRIETEDGLPHVLAINTLAPYILTALIEKPKRLVYLSSGMHRGADASLLDITWTERPWQGAEVYAESKLYVVLLAFAVARRWLDLLSNALEPGWVPTKMGTLDDMDQAHRTQAWLAASTDPAALVSGKYFYHLRHCAADPGMHDFARQEVLLSACQRLSALFFRTLEVAPIAVQICL
jgi:NAD(P)-dependent dehydrogenase (short-subunit alcohol dehydrogenase family)